MFNSARISANWNENSMLTDAKLDCWFSFCLKVKSKPPGSNKTSILTLCLTYWGLYTNLNFIHKSIYTMLESFSNSSSKIYGSSYNTVLNVGHHAIKGSYILDLGITDVEQGMCETHGEITQRGQEMSAHIVCKDCPKPVTNTSCVLQKTWTTICTPHIYSAGKIGDTSERHSICYNISIDFLNTLKASFFGSVFFNPLHYYNWILLWIWFGNVCL